METSTPSRPAVLIILGAAGDLAWRKLVPALYDLHIESFLPAHWAVVGLDRKDIGDVEFRQHLREGVNQFARRGPITDEQWEDFCGHLQYMIADFADPGAYARLAERLAALDDEWQAQAAHVFYQATPPSVVSTLLEQLSAAGLLGDEGRARMVFEKPFGRDLASAQKLNRELRRTLHESQIYRIDHYLGKETVQNLLALRFANALFEPIWDRRYIDHVQITVAEQVGVEHRGAYYDQAGALRDMVPNHMFQILCLIAMEPPVSFAADEVRNKKVDVLRAVRPIPVDRVAALAVRGQYGTGSVDGKTVPGYRDEPGIAPDSNTETFVALKLHVDNWRWQGIPFYLRTGKRLPARDTEIDIQFRAVPHRSFPSSVVADWRPNRLVVHIQPDEGIELRFQAKRPGPHIDIGPVMMRFSYREAFHAAPPDAYETLLLDAIEGDATLFMRADQVEIAWEVLSSIQQAWETAATSGMPAYGAGSWGPQEAEDLIARDGRSWLLPTQLEKSGDGTAPS